MSEKKKEVNLTESLGELQEIVAWFEEQDDVDVEQGLVKVREAAGLIKGSKQRLSQIQNEFKEIEKEIGDSPEEKNEISNNKKDDEIEYPDDGINPEDIPF